MLISAYVREKDRVLDFACGKGGDLTKYRKANVGTYTGVDIALESVRRDAVERYNGGGYPFPARFIAGDCFTADLTEVLEERAFDVISCQFAVHYRCAADDAPSRAVALVPLVALARTIPSPYTSNDTLTLHTPHPDTPTLRTAQLEHRGARASLVPQRESAAPSRGLLRRHHRRRQRPGSKTSRGGRPRLRQSHRRSSFRRRAQVQALPPDRGPFGLQYAFTLADAVTDCEEWMVPKKRFVELAEEYGLELVEWSNFHDFVHRKLGGDDPGEDADRDPAAKPGEVRGGRGRRARAVAANHGRSAPPTRPSPRMSGSGHLYTTFAFKMGGGGAAAARAIMTRPEPPPPAQIRREDVLVLEGAAWRGSVRRGGRPTRAPFNNRRTLVSSRVVSSRLVKTNKKGVGGSASSEAVRSRPKSSANVSRRVPLANVTRLCHSALSLGSSRSSRPESRFSPRFNTAHEWAARGRRTRREPLRGEAARGRRSRRGTLRGEAARGRRSRRGTRRGEAAPVVVAAVAVSAAIAVTAAIAIVAAVIVTPIVVAAAPVVVAAAAAVAAAPIVVAAAAAVASAAAGEIVRKAAVLAGASSPSGSRSRYPRERLPPPP